MNGNVGVGFIRPEGLVDAGGLDKSSPYKNENKAGFIRPGRWKVWENHRFRNVFCEPGF